jgi:hypothetical protein
MKFLRNYTIVLKDLPKYVDFNSEWKEPIDLEICRLLLESDDERISPLMKTSFRKTYDLIDRKTSELSVLYRPRFGCGRRYPEKPSEEFWTNKDGDKVRNEKYRKYWGNLTIHSKFIKKHNFYLYGMGGFRPS